MQKYVREGCGEGAQYASTAIGFIITVLADMYPDRFTEIETAYNTWLEKNNYSAGNWFHPPTIKNSIYSYLKQKLFNRDAIYIDWFVSMLNRGNVPQNKTDLPQ